MSYGNYPDLKKVQRILVIKMRHHGDVLLTSPIFSLLKKKLPEAQIDTFIYADGLAMLEGHPAISKFFLYDRSWKKLNFLKKLFKEAQLLWAMRKQKYDLILNLTEGDRGAIVAIVSGARYRIGFDPHKKGFLGKRKVYTHLIKNCRTPRHTVEKQLDALRCIGIFPDPEERELFFHVPEEARQRARELAQLKDYILIHPVSRWRFKCPPTAKMAQLVKALREKDHPVVITSGPDQVEKTMVEAIIAEAQTDVINLSGKTTLKELGALIERAHAVICVDSVPLHLASALKTPVVALFGPTSEIEWGPWQHPQARIVAQKWHCRPCGLDGCGGSKVSDCLSQLSITTILENLEDVSSKHPENDRENAHPVNSLKTLLKVST